jgi:Tfp pilus assembly protein PilV
MKKRRGDSLIEILIAFLIIIIAISISVLASSQVNQLKKQAVVKTHIYDLAYSYAEEQLASTILFSDTDYSTEVTIEDNDFILTFTIETSPTTTINDFFGESIDIVTLKVTLNNEKDKDGNDKYQVQMLVIPKQQP